MPDDDDLDSALRDYDDDVDALNEFLDEVIERLAQHDRSTV